jgi:hypothetical protein
VRTKQLQATLEMKAKARNFWRSMRALMTSVDTKEVMEIFRMRIQAKADEYVEKYDKCSPDDAIGIARCQEGRLICREIVSEFNAETCNKMIEKLDEEIKSISKEIEKLSKAGTDITGFDALSDKK